MDAFLSRVRETLAQMPKLIRITGFKRAVFVGDTHGDLEASQRVVKRYLDEKTALIFVGDYVDRGPNSLENINKLLQVMLEHPKQVVLLQGNHEGWSVSPFVPADFWENLPGDLQKEYAKTLAMLPLAAALPNGILGLHGALPAVEKLDDIDQIELGSNEWRQITWGDWNDAPGQSLGDMGSRPQFGRGRFESLIKRFGMSILIRGHQPNAPLLLYDERCITIFTSASYARPRTVAVADMNRQIKSARDLHIVEI